jgi:hypothetical protein
VALWALAWLGERGPVLGLIKRLFWLVLIGLLNCCYALAPRSIRSAHVLVAALPHVSLRYAALIVNYYRSALAISLRSMLEHMLTPLRYASLFALLIVSLYIRSAHYTPHSVLRFAIAHCSLYRCALSLCRCAALALGVLSVAK